MHGLGSGGDGEPGDLVRPTEDGLAACPVEGEPVDALGAAVGMADGDGQAVKALLDILGTEMGSNTGFNVCKMLGTDDGVKKFFAGRLVRATWIGVKSCFCVSGITNSFQNLLDTSGGIESCRCSAAINELLVLVGPRAALAQARQHWGR